MLDNRGVHFRRVGRPFDYVNFSIRRPCMQQCSGKCWELRKTLGAFIISREHDCDLHELFSTFVSLSLTILTISFHDLLICVVAYALIDIKYFEAIISLIITIIYNSKL